jgi:hypothetical protein
MNRSLQIVALAVFSLFGATSCMKDGEITIYHGPYLSTTPLEQKADSLSKFLIGNHFLPVEFYADKPIDYIETNNTVLAETDLNKYIMNYIKDDVIPFNEDHSLPVMQNALMMPGTDSVVLNRTWSVSTSKEMNEVHLTYLDYYYHSMKYTIVEFKDDYFLGYINWTSQADNTKTAKLFTKFKKQ